MKIIIAIVLIAGFSVIFFGIDILGNCIDEQSIRLICMAVLILCVTAIWVRLVVLEHRRTSHQNYTDRELNEIIEAARRPNKFIQD